MTLLPASAELAANAGTGPEGHKRSASVDSGTSSDATIVADDVASIDDADMGAVDGCHKAVATEEALTSPSERSPKRATGVHDQEAHDAKRGRVSTDTASGAPALTTTNTAGSSTVAAPMLASVITATALAVADPNADAHTEPNEAPDAGYHEDTPALSAPVATAHDAVAAAMASRAGPEVVIALSTPAPASSAIVDLSIVDNHDLAPASGSSTTGAASALGAAACESDTIIANETSRGDAGCPETPVISRRSHAVAIRAFSIGRTSTLAPAPQAGGSKSAVIVANATSRVHAHCPATPVVSRLPMPRAVDGSQHRAFCIGRRSSTLSTAAPVPATTLAAPLAAAPAPADPPMPATTLGHLGRAGSSAPPQNSPARIGALRAISRVVRRGMGAIRNALVALFKGDIEPTNRHRATSPGPLDEDGCWDEGASIDAALFALAKRERRRFL